MRMLRFVMAVAAGCVLAVPASANVLIQVDKSTQRMTVSENGQPIYNWPVSTGVSAYDTPSGNFTPFRMEKDHFSREWDNAPMPNSIFFTRQGHAIHGTTHASIGRPASHGCVRLSVEHSRVLFDLVKREGMPNTRVVLTGEVPSNSAPAMVRRAPRYDDGDVTGSAFPRQDARTYSSRDDRPVYWGQRTAQPSDFYDDGPRYRALPPPPPRYYYRQRSGWDWD